MEIVRQRKKRLLAWILTLVLCVGMWQGNVYAAGGELRITFPKGWSIYNIELICGEDPKGGKVIQSNTGSIAQVMLDNDIISDAYAYIEQTSEKGIATYKHQIHQWAYTKVDENQTQTEVELGGPGLKLSDLPASEVGMYDVTATLGKSVVLTYWNASGSGYPEDKPQIVGSTQFDVNTPDEVGIPSMQDNNFFVGWSNSKDSNSVVYEASGFYDYGSSFEQLIDLYPVYSDTVSKDGSFSLSDEKQYKLGTGKWTVNGMDDGCTYEGGISFYVPQSEDGGMTNYSFSVLPQ